MYLYVYLNIAISNSCLEYLRSCMDMFSSCKYIEVPCTHIHPFIILQTSRIRLIFFCNRINNRVYWTNTDVKFLPVFQLQIVSLSDIDIQKNWHPVLAIRLRSYQNDKKKPTAVFSIQHDQMHLVLSIHGKGHNSVVENMLLMQKVTGSVLGISSPAKGSWVVDDVKSLRSWRAAAS